MAARPTKGSELRAGCCADWPKPCGYHEGYLDGFEHGVEVGRSDREDHDGWMASFPITTKDQDRHG